MLRSIAKEAAAHVVSWTRLDAVAREHLHSKMPYIAGYHRVVERFNVHKAFALPAMEITTAMFEKHLDWLGERFEIVSLGELTVKMNRRARSKPMAALTFDDGYSEVFHNGFPLLKRKGIPASFFVITDLIGTTQAPLHDRLYAVLSSAGIPNPFSATQNLVRNHDYDNLLRMLESMDAGGEISRNAPDALDPLTWEMLAEMRDAGMTIGSHSKTHAFLTNEGPERVRQEAEDSRAVLQQKLGIDADFFAYPGGDFNAAVVDAVDRAGYRLAFTVCGHRDARHPMLTIRRRGLWEQSCVDRHGRFSPVIMSGHAASMFGRAAECPNSH
jgi:peptidoglycan/xylan/chitin deacetylase (PgdA/CDA1 family)